MLITKSPGSMRPGFCQELVRLLRPAKPGAYTAMIASAFQSRNGAK